MLYTICKFILNAKAEAKYPLISRSLGKVVVPHCFSAQLDPKKHNDSFWMVKILRETDMGNRGVIEVDPLYQITPICLLPGQYEVDQQGHWTLLRLSPDLPVRAYIVPQTIKQPFLKSSSARPSISSVVCVPYAIEDLKFLPPN